MIARDVVNEVNRPLTGNELLAGTLWISFFSVFHAGQRFIFSVRAVHTPTTAGPQGQATTQHSHLHDLLHNLFLSFTVWREEVVKV